MTIEDEAVTFKVFKAIDFPPLVQSCTQSDDLDTRTNPL